MATIKVNTIVGEGAKAFIGVCPNLDFLEVIMANDAQDAKRFMCETLAHKYVENNENDDEINAFVDDHMNDSGEPCWVKEIGTAA